MYAATCSLPCLSCMINTRACVQHYFEFQDKTQYYEISVLITSKYLQNFYCTCFGSPQPVEGCAAFRFAPKGSCTKKIVKVARAIDRLALIFIRFRLVVDNYMIHNP
jgi:hypothetical protein